MTPSRFIAGGFGSGCVPIAPGTAASAIALLAGALLLHISPILLPTAALLAALGGLWAIGAARVQGDPGWVVIDEFAGQWLAMCGLSRASLPGLLAAFGCFACSISSSLVRSAGLIDKLAQPASWPMI